MQVRAAYGALGERREVFVVGEEDHLRALGEFVEGFEGGAASVVVELHQDVVHGKRQRLVGFEAPFEAREPQREVQLVPRADRATSRVHPTELPPRYPFVKTTIRFVFVPLVELSTPQQLAVFVNS